MNFYLAVAKAERMKEVNNINFFISYRVQNIEGTIQMREGR